LVLVVLFSAVLAVGLLGNSSGPPATRMAGTGAVLLLGCGAFAAGRVIGGGHGPAELSVHLVVLNSLAAVAEEAFFRRLWYALLLPAGPLFAVAGSTVLFAAVHLATYGPAVLPLDLAAGLVLGWQRWATGSWGAPALTHIVANILVVI
jgi:membrane protease YdiL (CAAX protease family)